MRLLVLMSRGASPWAQELVGSLKASGHELHLLDFEAMPAGGMPTNSADTEATEREFQSVHLVRGARSSLALVLPLRRLARRIKPHLVLCLYGGRFALAAWLSGCRPYVVYVVGSDVLLAGTAQRWLNRLTLGAAALVLANGGHLAWQARVQAPAAQVEMLLLGVDVRRLVPRARRAIPRIFNHRTFSATYDNESIIRALAALPPNVPRFEMIFASGGPDLAVAEALADRLLLPRIRGFVEFWRGHARREQILESLAETDFYISMARSDGTATSVLEAMSCGAFPLLSDIPANRPLVDEAVGVGVLVPVGDHAALARRLEACLRDVATYRVRLEAVRHHVATFADATANRAILIRRLQSVAQAAC